MNGNPNLNRRQFLRTTGQAATTLAAASALAPAILCAESPNKTIGVGCIGVGTRGGDLLEAVAHAPNVKVTAISDVKCRTRGSRPANSRNWAARSPLKGA